MQLPGQDLKFDSLLQFIFIMILRQYGDAKYEVNSLMHEKVYY